MRGLVVLGFDVRGFEFIVEDVGFVGYMFKVSGKALFFASDT